MQSRKRTQTPDAITIKQYTHIPFHLCALFPGEKSISDRMCLEKPAGDSETPPEDIRDRFIPKEEDVFQPLLWRIVFNHLQLRTEYI